MFYLGCTFKCLFLGIGNREFKDNFFTSQLLVTGRKCVKLVFQRSMILAVQQDLNQFAAIHSDLCSLTNNFSRVNHIFQQLFMDRSKSTGSGSLLTNSSLTSRLLKDTTLSNQQDMTVRELLFQFTDKTSLDLVELFQKRDRDKDNNSLATMTNINLHQVELLP